MILNYRLFFFILCIGFCLSVNAQHQNFEEIVAFIDDEEPYKAIQKLEDINIDHLSSYDKATYYYYLAEAESNVGKFDEAFAHTLLSKKLFTQEDAPSDVLDCNLLLISILDVQDGYDFKAKNLEEELRTYVNQQKDPKAAFTLNTRIGSRYLDNDLPQKAILFFLKNDSIGKTHKNKRFSISAYANVSTVYSLLKKDFDSALFYNKKAIKIYNENPNDTKLLSYLYNNQARIHQSKQNYKDALAYYQKADSIEIKGNIGATKRIYYANLSSLYESMGDYKNAYNYLKKEKIINDSIEQSEQNIALSDIQTKYETEKKEKENILLKTDLKKKKQTQFILWLGIISSIIIGTTISLLIAKNAKKKRLLNKQEQKIKIQEIEQGLKEQELNSIDALIAGQEKERQRLAENLHDNLGATLAALKLNIQHIKTGESNSKSIKNSIELINDAYDKVRSIAHEKSTGVIAKNGLLPAIKDMAKRISTNNFTVIVEDYGLENRLENTLEIRIFRIIQELITNIIKHANATEATVSLTNHNSTLNIIVEDNGKGFDEKFTYSQNKGMGLSSIEKRVENIGGTLEVDSFPNKGTSIIINLPL